MGIKIYLDGKFVEQEDAKISVFDHGLLYGDGVFEGIRSYKRRVFRLGEHLDRLYDGAEAMRLKVPMTREEMQEAILETLKVNDLDNAYIRCVVTRGVGDLGLDPRKCSHATVFIIADKIALYPRTFYETGLPIVTAKTRRNHPQCMSPRIKSLNYLNNILGKIDAIDADTQEAIMLSVDGDVVECTGDNIFIMKEGLLVTPPSELGALPGITQKAVIELAGKRGIETDEVAFKIEDVYNADECFLTGTAAEIVPVIKVDDRTIGTGKPGDMTRQLLEDYKKLTATYGVEY